jgi:molybdopterin synthase sulfur carrier subunit
MQIKLLAFAQARIELGFAERSIACAQSETPRAILQRVAPQYHPGSAVRIAVNRAYADWDMPIGEAFELAIIPLVSGG